MTHQELAEKFLLALHLDEEKIRRISIEFAYNEVPIIKAEMELWDADSGPMEEALFHLKRFRLSEVSDDHGEEVAL